MNYPDATVTIARTDPQRGLVDLTVAFARRGGQWFLKQVLDENGDLQEFVIQSIDHRIGTANLVHEVNTTLVRATGEDNTALVIQGARRRRR